VAIQNVVSKDILQDSLAALPIGQGACTVGGVPVTRLSRSAKILEFWANVLAIDAGVTANLILESRLEGMDAWVEIARITVTTAAVGTPPAVFAASEARWGDKPLGEEVRASYDIAGGTITADLFVVRKE
jgi:hypothetical protein